MDNYFIRTEHLSYYYTDNNDVNGSVTKINPAIDNISLSIEDGEYVAVLGHNGSGKSTLAKMLNLILTPTSGKIYIDGDDVTRDDFSEDDVFKVRGKIGMVFQNPDNQLVATIVEEDVAFGPENLGIPSEEIRRRVNSSLSLVGMLDYAKHAPHKLSGGQKQRVAIAGVIAMRPRAIIFDESTAMLDPMGRREVINIMERLNREEGITIINITHYMDEAARADRVIVINDGKMKFDGTPKEVFSMVDELREIGLEAPQSRVLLHELGNMGVKIESDALTEEECSDALINFLKANK